MKALRNAVSDAAGLLAKAGRLIAVGDDIGKMAGDLVGVTEAMKRFAEEAIFLSGYRAAITTLRGLAVVAERQGRLLMGEKRKQAQECALWLRRAAWMLGGTEHRALLKRREEVRVRP